MKKDTRWLISFVISIVLLLVVPWFKLIFLFATILHIPVFIYGILEIQNCFFCKAHCHNKKKSSECSLTFDGGPDPQFTPHILDLLKKYNFKATFFVAAKIAQAYPEIIRECIKQGHCIACYDLDYKMALNFRLYKRLVREIGEAQRIIKEITGKKPLLYRPPVGLTNRNLRKALKDLSMECIGWSSSVRDGGNRFPKTFTHLPELARPGSVILLHDMLPANNSSELYLKNLEKLFIRIQETGLKPVTVDSLFELTAYSE
ncbi:MAG: polysaccharide deacetylase family protein [Chitinispirillaceae bacterium]|nr:polysaccharide deacetylase family protein [Chitinispirillaceae bacterium]